MIVFIVVCIFAAIPLLYGIVELFYLCTDWEQRRLQRLNGPSRAHVREQRRWLPPCVTSRSASIDWERHV